MELLLIPFGLIFLVVLLGCFGTRRQDCAVNTTPEQPQRGPDFAGVTADVYYSDEVLYGSGGNPNEPAKSLPQPEMYTYSRENAAEEWQDMNSRENVIDAKKYSGDYWAV